MSHGTLRDATISDCGLYRYWLRRKWAHGSPLLFVMYNPSTADHMVDDRTIGKCTGFAKSAGFGSLEVVNLFAYRTPYPKDLKAAGYPVGPDNDKHITDAAQRAGAVCVAWGANAAGLSRPAKVLEILRDTGHHIQCLRITKSGHPEHPLFLPSSCKLGPFTAQSIRLAMHP